MCWQIFCLTFWCMSSLCYCFWPSLRASTLHLLCQQFFTWFMHAILCSVLMTLFSHIFSSSLSVSLSLYLSLVMCCNNIYQVVFFWVFGKLRLMMCSTNLSSGYPTSLFQLWHCPSNCTLLKAPYKYSNITRTKMSHWRFKLSIWFKLKVLLTYLALY